jgi:FlaA1/EpsC-like NDP-sugar epimerase
LMPATLNRSSSSGGQTSFAGLLRYRRGLVIALHIALIAASNYGAFWLRFEGAIPAPEFDLFVRMLPWLLAIRTMLFVPVKLYEGLWRYTSIWDLRNILVGVGSSTLGFYVLVQWIFGLKEYPRSIVFIDSLLLICVMSGTRLGRRMYREFCRIDRGKRVLVFGAGDAGEALVRDIQTNTRRQYRVIGFVDDDPAKVGRRIHGVPVLGTRDNLSRIMVQRKPDEVLLAIPGSGPAALRSVVRTLDRYNVPIKTVPTLNDILENRVEVSQIRNLSVEDLLSRGRVDLDPAPLRLFLKGRRVLVTGAGGSIGAELCRQIVSCGAQALVLFERHENSLYHIANDLADRGHRTGVHPVIGDVADKARVADVLTRYRPEIIFHAAAHKHVPLMEGNACEAVKNNVTGTRLLMEAAEHHGVDRFILISTDKAVNPTSVMGATKRVAELMLLTQGVGSGTSFMTVRFGNVLASSGSVVPRFVEQIKAGGPVTVTHPEIRRYFMLIPEAVQLVLHTAARGEGGKLYALEMGEQVKLADMARDLIRLAGFIPEVEIPIAFIGLRPGEKLYEELVGPDEIAEFSGIGKVMGVRPVVMPVPQALAQERARLEDAAQRNDTRSVLEHLGRLVPAFDTGRPDAEATISAVEVLPTTGDPSKVKSRAVADLLCPICDSPQVHRSHPRSQLEEWRKSHSQKRPYRCHVCDWRGWLLPQEPSGAHSVAVEDLLSPDFRAIDESVATVFGENRTVFSPRDLPTP